MAADLRNTRGLHVVLGRIDEARKAVAEMSRLEKPAGDALAPLLTSYPGWREQRLAALRKAGWEM